MFFLRYIEDLFDFVCVQPSADLIHLLPDYDYSSEEEHHAAARHVAKYQCFETRTRESKSVASFQEAWAEKPRLVVTGIFAVLGENL